MPTSNQALFDRAVRHQIDLQRYSKNEVKAVIEKLSEVDAEIVEKLRLGLQALPTGRPIRPAELTKAQRKHLEATLEDIRVLQQEAYRKVGREFTQEMKSLASQEAEFEVQALNSAASFSHVSINNVSVADIHAIIKENPFEGQLLNEWFSKLKVDSQVRVKSTIINGLVQGQSKEDIVRVLAGTKKEAFTDGVLAISRRNASTIVRTAINTYSNAAHEKIWEANDDIIQALRWTSTLDGRTSAICRGRDGRLTDGRPKLSPDGVRPPAHFNCRSLMVPVLDGDTIVGNRPFITDTRTRRQREIDFRAEAKEAAGADRWKRMNLEQRRGAIRSRRNAWKKANIGQAPGDTTYEEFLRGQPAEFQAEVLGSKKAILFRKGELPLDKYTSRLGDELTLKQLEERFPKQWDKAFGD